MCGIFGYIGPKNAPDVVLEGLKRLEYRGYDSWGIAIVADGIKLNKKVGAIGDLDSAGFLPASNVGVGHTRWATHGGVSDINAHPHFSSDKSFCLSQNGIVENYQKLQEDLSRKGYKFQTETDTEVIVRLIEDKLKTTKQLYEAVRLAFLDLKGRNTIIILSREGQIIAARNGSPLVIGINEKEIFFSSDTLSFAPHTKKMIVCENGQMAYSENGKIKLLDIKSKKDIPYKLEDTGVNSSKVDKEGYEHFMLKEVYEIPYTITHLASLDLEDYKEFIEAVKQAPNIYTIGSGTAGVASAQIAFYLREFSKIKATPLVGADSYEYISLFKKGDLIIATSQSGETADVLEVLEEAKKKGVKIASLVNMPGSTMTRISDFKFMNQAGPEICVVSTKVFISQIAWGYMISKIISGEGISAQQNLKLLAESAETYLNTEENHTYIKKLAKKLLQKKDIFLLGKSQNYNIIREGMVKIIECAYKHAHAMPAGDLKHYAITIMQNGVPVIVAVSEDKVKPEVMNAVNEVRTRGAEVIGISSKKDDNFDFFLQVPETKETSAIMNVIPLYLLAYYMAFLLGHNVDKPRNLAKSVTVK